MDDSRDSKSLTVQLPPKLEEVVKERAAALGLDASTYISRLVDHLATRMTYATQANVPERILLCSTVYENALLYPLSPSGDCVTHAWTWPVRLVASEELFEHLRYFSEHKTEGFMVEPIEPFIDKIREKSEVARSVPGTHFEHADEKTSHYANLAIETGRFGITIVTCRKDLLWLADVNHLAGQEFTCRFPSVRIVEPDTFLKERGYTEQTPEDDFCTHMLPGPNLNAHQAHVIEVAKRRDQDLRDLQTDLREMGLRRDGSPEYHDERKDKGREK